MHKLVFGLSRAEGMSVQEFREYWLDEHAPVASELPGLRRYTVSFPTDPDRSQYDGFAQLYFDDEVALQAAMDSTEGGETARDLANFTGDSMLQMVVEEHVVVGESEGDRGEPSKGPNGDRREPRGPT
ncbi:EthD family reductase [Halomarina oriensis]|uniref:EthD family reductase n=1 Tax=Halomarina oriensis TaxID=671145 RepID=A0A6B0GJC0_9EURY|nr:EthD family reductase [Halomarina oriensis]MWG32923.1 EthD family reductase [Halomarina oriensis]